MASWLTGAAAVAMILTAAPSQAEGVAVSIRFEGVPSAMLNAPAVPPEEIKTCLVRQALLNGLIGDDRPAPMIQCLSPSQQPLVVSQDSAGGLIVRP